jgi:hypothetical protein
MFKAHPFLTARQYAKLSTGHEKPQNVVWPSDLTYGGGPVLATAKVYNAFVNSSSATFGLPYSFETHLSYSQMIHITDQYVGTTGTNRYNWAGDTVVKTTFITNVLGDNDLLSIVHAVAKAIAPNAGRKNIYNIFLPSGLDYCSTGAIGLPPGACNASLTSPNPFFCGFHDAVAFSDIGEVLFTFQPFQDLNFCAANADRPSDTTPNGLQNDSTYSTLSHELFETITDPEPGSGWYAFVPLLANGEIGDLCAYLGQTVNLSGKNVYIQREYSNKVHGCDNLAP